MGSTELAALAAILVFAGLLVAAVLAARAHRADRHELAAVHAEVAALRAELEELARRPQPAVLDHRTDPRASAELLITSAGEERQRPVVVPDRVVLGATVGEPLLRALALGHGVRRALSAESRNRILFEVRREVRRSRRERRRDVRRAARRLHAEQREAAG